MLEQTEACRTRSHKGSSKLRSAIRASWRRLCWNFCRSAMTRAPGHIASGVWTDRRILSAKLRRGALKAGVALHCAALSCGVCGVEQCRSADGHPEVRTVCTRSVSDETTLSCSIPYISGRDPNGTWRFRSRRNGDDWGRDHALAIHMTSPCRPPIVRKHVPREVFAVKWLDKHRPWLNGYSGREELLQWRSCADAVARIWQANSQMSLICAVQTAVTCALGRADWRKGQAPTFVHLPRRYPHRQHHRF